MATIKFRIKNNSKKDKSTIYIYLSNGRGNLFEAKTGFSIQQNDWNEKIGLPKQNNSESKILRTNLKQLDSHIHNSINTANSTGEIINKFWLDSKIKECFSRVVKTDADVFVNHLQYMIDNARNKRVSGKKTIGLSESRIKSYKSFLIKMMAYQEVIKKTIRFTEINDAFAEGLINWLIDKECFSVGYAGKQIDNLKAVCNDAERMGIPTNPGAKNIKSFVENDEDRYIMTLSFKELEIIYNTPMPNKYLENAKKWILIGCELGQRGEDLLNVTKDKMRFIEDELAVDIHQQKTKKDVTVVIMKPEIADIAMKDLPHKISLQKLNKYMKEVCEIAGLTELTKGYKLEVNESNQRRKKLGRYPKWELITSHSMRRSFATNYYKVISLAALMNFTGHSRESDFLKYINRKADKDDYAKLFIMQYKMHFLGAR